ncbi:hypothetical protein FVE85_1417 [Porphyridium purpureum]|uniref:RING-type domain-containing protein n=1 Tax=Porphyridium purpureum TaxID=35688 RepID=A0A5J4YWN2_PORPP|nr:hypothetical protein FVE85_1417 [Porphyridium purpureum]|eukprot:POR1824..scf209_3
MAVVRPAAANVFDFERSASRSSTSTTNACHVCFDSRETAVLSPCLHELCLSCVAQLIRPECPFCRTPLTSVTSSAASAPSCTYAALRNSRLERDLVQYRNVLQVVLVGTDTAKMKTLARKLCQAYRLENIPESLPDELLLAGAGSSNCSRFLPNARVRNALVRFCVVPTVSSASEHRPDLILLCGGLNQGQFDRLTEIDTFLSTSCAGVPRLWAFIASPEKDEYPNSLLLLKQFQQIMLANDPALRPHGYQVVYPAVQFLRSVTAFISTLVSAAYQHARVCRAPQDSFQTRLDDRMELRPGSDRFLSLPTWLRRKGNTSSSGYNHGTSTHFANS